ncbi:hypothetical protein Ddye_016841 [Dipteronia dyeriana]|uniref:Uncharacterized protein n=1 Tax=Dipteronia dyeriana TaxID=168575 RepID=A0AAD9X0P6_9ROSI|nr:hypothetical protein Ddye_016841 [Dipteronia dyeriana]
MSNVGVECNMDYSNEFTNYKTQIPRNIKTVRNLSFSKSERSNSQTDGKLIDDEVTGRAVIEKGSSFFFHWIELFHHDIEMRIMLRNSLKTAEGDWYKSKLTRHNHFDALGHIDDALNRVPVEFADEDRRRFMASCFGHFLKMHREMKFSGGIIHQLLLREPHHNSPTYKMQFMLGNQWVRFSNVEFCLITGLRFGVVSDTTKYAAVENGIHELYFPGADEVWLEEIRGVITGTEFGKAYDAVKLCLLYMLN